MLSVDCLLLCVGWLFVVCCVFVARRSLFVVCWLLVVVVRCGSFVGCWLLFVVS